MNIQSFEEYRQLARQTALFVDRTDVPKICGLMYCALGIAGEVAELTAIIDRVNNHFVPAKDVIDDIIKEAGDVYWYIANLSLDLAIPSEKFDQSCDIQYGSFMEHAFDTVGTISEIIKKIFRDCPANGPFESSRMCDLKKAIIDLFHLVKFEVYCIKELIITKELSNKDAEQYRNTINITTEMKKVSLEIMATNIEKLFSRKERGVLLGNGDNR